MSNYGLALLESAVRRTNNDVATDKVNIAVLQTTVAGIPATITAVKDTTGVVGILKGDGTTITAAVADTDYASTRVATTLLNGLVPNPGSASGKVLSDAMTWIAAGGGLTNFDAGSAASVYGGVTGLDCGSSTP